MGIFISILLLLLAGFLFIQVKRGKIDSKVIQVLADIASVVSLLLAVYVFLRALPAPSPEPTPSAAAGVEQAVSSPSPRPTLPKASFTPEPPAATEPVSNFALAEPGEAEAYSLPLKGALDLLYKDSSLWMHTQDRLVKLAVDSGSLHLRAEEELEFPRVSSLAWDSTHGVFWAAETESILRLSASGEVLDSFDVSGIFSGRPTFLAWDGAHLWAADTGSVLYKLEAGADASGLERLDSYAISVGEFPSSTIDGLAWDGSYLWVLSDQFITKLSADAQSLCRVMLPPGYPQPTWWGWRGLAADGQWLWAAHEEESRVYRADPAACR